MKKKVETESKTKVLRKAILKLEPAIIEYQQALTRLRGIVSGTTEAESEKKAVHRVQTILGYRKRLLKIGAGVHTLLGELAGVEALL